MEISFDPKKRAWTLAERGLDFADVSRVFAGVTLTLETTGSSIPNRAIRRMGGSANGWC